MEEKVIDTLIEEAVVEPVVETVQPAEPKSAKTRAKKTVKPSVKATTVNGVTVCVVGEAVHGNKGSVQYRSEVSIPRHEQYELYLREAILMKLREEDLVYSGVVTWNVDKIEDADVSVSFMGKNIFDLSRSECFAVKAYYGLGGFPCHEGDLRTLQKELYRRFAYHFHIDNGASEEYLKWQPITLKPMIAPMGDEVLAKDLPVAFDDNGTNFVKVFRK